MTPLLQILILAFIGSVAGLLGGVIFLIKKNWAHTLCLYAVPFAAGVLLSVSLLHLLPEAADKAGESAFLFVLIALLLSFFFEQFFARLHHHEHQEQNGLESSVPLVILGDTIHNFIDGVAIASAFLVEPHFGLIIALAAFLHETPHEIGDFGILMAAGWSRAKTFAANFFSALSTFPGALLVFYLMRDADEKIGILLAVSAGVFLYLGASDFLPRVGEGGEALASWKKFSLLILGVALVYLLILLLP
jgi:zinc and cadmium transporter